MCNCQKNTSQVDDIEFSAINFAGVSSAFSAIRPMTLAADAPVTEVVFASKGIDRVFSSSYVDFDGTGKITLRGNIGLISVEADISISIKDGEIVLTLDVTQPIKIGPLTWRFGIAGDQLTLLSGPTPPLTAGLDWWCVAKCAGLSILPTLVMCLPSLVGGPPAYIACVTAKVGTGDAAAIAACVASKCV